MMTRAQALAEAQRRWGRNALARFEKRALTEAEKEPLRPILKALRDEKRPETATERSTLTGKIITYRCSVGELSGFAFHVRGWGDTWEEAFTRADQK